MFGWMGWMDGWMVQWVQWMYVWMGWDRWVNKQMINGWVGGWDEQLWMDVGMSGWLARWMDVFIRAVKILGCKQLILTEAENKWDTR